MPPQFNSVPDEDFSKFEDLTCEGYIPVRGFRMVQYLDDDGDTVYSWAITGDAATDEVLKLLAIATYQVGVHAMKQYLDALEED